MAFRTLKATLVAALPLLAYAIPQTVTGDTPAPAADPAPAGGGSDYKFTLRPQRIAPDGIERTALVINGKMPGPLIKAKQGDTVHVNVENDLNSEELHHLSSIHWHGIHMLNNNFDDGAATVTQCPIIPGNSYEYTLPIKQQYGTFWYHSHFSSQYCDGLRGPLVVYHPNDPHKKLYDVDDESTIISLVDWYAIPAKEAFHPGPGNVSPHSRSTLINGLGIAANTSGQSGSLSVINVQPNKRYRFRLINMSCDPWYKFSVDGHKLTVIEADSIETQPYEVDRIDIFAGQRYSFVLNANQRVGNYWIRSLPNVAYQTDFKNNVHTAILRYKGAPIALPPKPADVDVPVLKKTLIEAELRPLENIPVPGTHAFEKSDVYFNFFTLLNRTANLFLMGNGTYGRTFTPPKVPILLQILSDPSKAKTLMPEGAIYTLPPNKTIEVTLPGDITGPHPFHLHGHDFWVVKSFDGSATSANWENAIRRDTVSAGMRDQSVTIRFRSDNPGPWFLHCHIDWHLDAGLGVVMVEDIDAIRQRKPDREWKQLCVDYDNYIKNGGEE